VELVNILETKRNVYMKAKIDELGASNKVKSIRDLYRSKND